MVLPRGKSFLTLVCRLTYTVLSHWQDGETKAQMEEITCSRWLSGGSGPLRTQLGIPSLPLRRWVALASCSGLQKKVLPACPALIHRGGCARPSQEGEIFTLQKSYERNYGWKNHYLINRLSCSELVGNRAYKIHMARWGFDSASLQLSDSSEKCPHPERANFPLLMTWGGADAINSSYLRA